MTPLASDRARVRVLALLGWPVLGIGCASAVMRPFDFSAVPGKDESLLVLYYAGAAPPFGTSFEVLLDTKPWGQVVGKTWISSLVQPGRRLILARPSGQGARSVAVTVEIEPGKRAFYQLVQGKTRLRGVILGAPVIEQGEWSIQQMLERQAAEDLSTLNRAM